MGGFHNIYQGGYNSFDSGYGVGMEDDVYGGFRGGYHAPFHSIGFPSDPTTANQIKAVSDKLNTGTRTVEVSGVNIAFGEGPMGLMDSIPKQTFTEIRRLKKLVGADLTFHGPLVELSGLDQSGKYEETDRISAEREAWASIERAQKLGPNIPVVFHSSNLPFGGYEKRVKNPITGEEEVIGGLFFDEYSNRLGALPPEKPDYFKDEKGKILKFDERIEEMNKKTWLEKLQRVNFAAEQATRGFEQAKMHFMHPDFATEEDKKSYMDFFKKYVKDPEGASEVLKQLGPKAGTAEKAAREFLYGEIYIKEAYNAFKDLYNEAYHAAKNNGQDKKLLDNFRNEIASKIDELEEDPSRIEELNQVLNNGISTLRRVQHPQQVRKLGDFMVDKSSDTVANLALKSYSRFKDNSPVIAIENPPADRFALSRADELKSMIDNSRKKFVERATVSRKDGGLGMSKSQAEKQAEKLIGLTWDTAHINLIQGHGYSQRDVLREAEKIAKYVKHIHISDNFGLANTELPPGMGNAPIGRHLEIIGKVNKKIGEIKKTVETGSWFSAMKFRHTPMLESVGALGSPIYSMKMAPQWNQAAWTFGGYFSGIGPTNPEIHHSMYGAGFSNLPLELGGQMQGRSRMGGTPME